MYYRHSSYEAVLLYSGIPSNAVFSKPKTALKFYLTRFFQKKMKKIWKKFAKLICKIFFFVKFFFSTAFFSSNVQFHLILISYSGTKLEKQPTVLVPIFIWHSLHSPLLWLLFVECTLLKKWTLGLHIPRFWVLVLKYSSYNAVFL